MLVILCDGGCKGNPGPMTGAVVAWNRLQGKGRQRVMPTMTARYDFGQGTNNEAEWLALIKALEYANETPMIASDTVHIYSDSQLVVGQVTKRYKVKSPKLIALQRKALHLIDSIPSCITITWVPRQLTILADRAANGQTQMHISTTAIVPSGRRL